jgi:hypothetical protein
MEWEERQQEQEQEEEVGALAWLLSSSSGRGQCMAAYTVVALVG